MWKVTWPPLKTLNRWCCFQKSVLFMHCLNIIQAQQCSLSARGHYVGPCLIAAHMLYEMLNWSFFSFLCFSPHAHTFLRPMTAPVWSERHIRNSGILTEPHTFLTHQLISLMKQILTFVVSTYGARHPWGPNFLRCLIQYWESQISTWWVNRFYDRFCFSLVLRDFLLWQGGLQGIQLLKHLDGINWDCDDKTWLNFNHVRISRITLSCEILGSDERNSLILTDGLHCRLWAIRGIVN